MSGPPAALTDDQWQRLDPRMLLVHPIREVLRFLPVLLGVFVAGSAAGGGTWQLAGVVVPVGLGLLRYLTTRFRIAAGTVELQRGLLNRHVLSAPLDRVRTVDLTASPIHRLLGLTTVRIGTGTAAATAEEQLDLDGLPAGRARLLREALLRVAPAPGAPGVRAPAERPTLRLDPAWVRFAPLTSSGLVVAAGILGAVSQLVGPLGRGDGVDLTAWADDAAALSVLVAAPLAVLALLALVSSLAIAGYLVTYWGFTLVHADRAWHLRRGLFTTRETSLDDARVGGVTLAEPLGLRLAGGARLAAIVTGLGSQQTGASLLVPPAPRTVANGVARTVLGAAAPVDAPLVGHGRAARRRRYARALLPALAAAGVAVALVASAGASRWWLLPAALAPVAATALAADRSRALGHLLVDGYLVARSGSLDRRRDALAVEAVIGWNLRSTWFQRRAGLTTLVATTAGGRQSVTVLDVPEGTAVALAARALPDLVGPFTRPEA